MRTVVLILFLGWLTGCGTQPAPDAGQAQQPSASPDSAATPTGAPDDLSGQWQVTSLLKSGQEALPSGPPIMLEFRDGWQIMTQAGAVLDESKYSLDATTNPKSIDTIVNAKIGNTVVTPGIYELSGDSLRLCMGSGQARPTVFESTQEYNLTVLKRVK